METIDFKKLKREMTMLKIKEKVVKGFNDTVQFCEDHKEIVMVAVPAVIGGALKLRKEHQETLHNLNEWDPRAGRNWALRRKPSTREALEIDRRYKLGESKGEILADLKLLR